MEEYPEELRTPPVSLVSLVGCPELHASITKHLHSQQPPINTLALPDFSKIQLLLSPSPQSSFKDPLSVTDPPKPNAGDGILKRDWLLKHRTKVPAVVAAFFPYDHISGDPTQWLKVCYDLDNLKTSSRPKNIKLLVVVVQSSPSGGISEDRLLALRKRAEVDSKYLLFFNSSVDAELIQSLNRLGAVLAELAFTFYKDEGKRIKTRIEKKNFSSTDLNIRYCFKVAVYAEFRRDWAESLKFYEDAYQLLREMVGTATRLPPIQRLVEIKTVAEQLHFKVSTLLLHGGKVTGAIKWFHQHKASYERLVGASDVMFLHWEWMSRQFLAFGELLETSSVVVQSSWSLGLGTAENPLTELEFYPAYYYQLVAHYLKEKRSALELVLSTAEVARELCTCSESVGPSVYIGQFVQLIEDEDMCVMHPLSDEDYTRFVIAEGKRLQDSFEIIALLKKAYEAFSILNIHRMASGCGFQIAKEYFYMSDYSTAKLFLSKIINLYRKEGWVTLLWNVLGYLRECSRKLGEIKDFIEYSLEMAALPVSSRIDERSLGNEDCGPAGPASLPRRENVHREVFELVSSDNTVPSPERGSNFRITEENPLHLEIDLVSPLRSALVASVAFHEQTIKSVAASLITLSLLSHLPLSIEIEEIEVQFNQSGCNFVIVNGHSRRIAKSSDQSGLRVENVSSLSLHTNKWLRLTHEIKPERSGKVECLSIITRLGPHFTICARAESPASMEDFPLWKYENNLDVCPTKDSSLAFYGQKASQVEEPEPKVDLILGASGPALVGEDFIMPVTIISKGHDIHSGELKINLVDIRGGGLFSPRDAEPYSLESHHVELRGILPQEGADDSEPGAEKIKKIQQSFGLVSVPFLKEGGSWSCKLEIKWHRPKPIMLFVSLGYYPQESDSSTQKVNLHKSMEVEGKTGMIICHRFLLPFRRDQLLLSRIKPVPDYDQMPSLPLNEKSVLIISAKNYTEIPLKLVSMAVEIDDSTRSFLLQHGGEDISNSGVLVPGGEFRKVFTIIPEIDSPKLMLGTVHLKWKRDAENDKKPRSCGTSESLVLTKHKLPDVTVERAPLVLCLECPPYAVLREPFKYLIKILNRTPLLQEVKFTLSDAQSFVLSGSHSDTIFILPRSEYILSYKLVALALGSQQLPKITVNSVRYSAKFQSSAAASTIFVFPCPPQLKEAATES